MKEEKREKIETKIQKEEKKSEEDHTLFNKIHSFLSDRKIEFQVMDHIPTRTSEESANVRNTPLEWGAKTMLINSVQGVLLLVYRANRKVSWSKLRKVEWVGKMGRMLKEE